MHEEVRATLTATLQKVLPIFHSLPERLTEPYLTWKKTGPGAWQGDYVPGPSFIGMGADTRAAIANASTEFFTAFLKHHPQYSGLVGTSLGASINLGHDPTRIVNGIMFSLWERHGTLEVNSTQVEELVNEFETFVDSPIVHVIGMAQLLNFDMPPSTLPLPKNIVVRHLTEAEISRIHGGPIWHRPAITSRPDMPQEFAIEGSFEVEKVFGTATFSQPTGFITLRDDFSQVVRALRAFKEGYVGFEYIHLKSRSYCPLIFGSSSSSDLFIPHGSYHVDDAEIEPLKQHVEYMFKQLHPALETACSRLGDAQTRLRAADRVVDAVIGLEALLLANLGTEDRRGELKYRFSTNYSTFFNSPHERYRAYRIAKAMYDLRSKNRPWWRTPESVENRR